MNFGGRSFRKWVILTVSLILFLAVGLGPSIQGLGVQGQWAIAVFCSVVLLWITTPISFPMIFFLEIFLLVVTGVLTPDSAFQGAGTPTIFFLIGAIILASAIKKHDLHKRIALTFLRWFGSSPRKFLLGMAFIASLLSMTMPAHGVVAFLIPVALGILRMAKRDMEGSNFTKVLLLTLSYASSVGSMGTLLGGARNPLAISLYFQATGNNISFLDWFVAAFPIAFLMTFVVSMVLIKVYPPEDVDMEHLRCYLKKEVDAMGSLSLGEKKTLVLFAAAFVMWAVFGTLLGLATVAVLIAALLGITGVLTWQDVEKKLPWGILFLYIGAITMALALVRTGAAEFIAGNLIGITGQNLLLLIFVVVVLTIFLSNVMSNSAATAVMLPLVLSIIISLGFAPILGVYVVALPSAFAFMFIIGTPGSAMVYDTGLLKVKDFIKPGLILNLIGIAVFMTLGLAWWRFIGLW